MHLWDGQEEGLEEEDDDEKDGAGGTSKKCVLVWQGVVKKPCFKNFHLEECRTEGLARKFLHDKGVEHYWDQCKKHNVDAQ